MTSQAESLSSPEREAEASGSDTGTVSLPTVPEIDLLSATMSDFFIQTMRVLSIYSQNFERNKDIPTLVSQTRHIVKVFSEVADYWLSDPAQSLKIQQSLNAPLIELWSRTLRRFSGEDNIDPLVPLDSSDRRFKDPEWSAHPLFDFFRQAYLISTDWAQHLVEDAGIEDSVKRDARFYLRHVTSALSPSNFLITNPELLRETLQSKGDNLVRGMTLLAEDLEAGEGQLKMRQSDDSAFTLGVTLAATPGSVIYRNEIMELIQYHPTTDYVYRRPLLIISPWINKYYILDLTPEKSFIRWAVDQGLTVFVISWVNPDEKLAHKSFEDYLKEGILESLTAIELATGEKDIAALGYCIGGTLLATALALLAEKGDRPISSATFFTTLVDFAEPGDLKVFLDEANLHSLEEKMAEEGYLDSQSLTNVFTSLRPKELFWSYFVDNYLKGKEPKPFDILTWNADSTRMPAANHSFYLRKFYLENALVKGKLSLGGYNLSLSKITQPIYHLAAQEDYIAPAASVYAGCRFFGGDIRFVLAGSGHVAGVVNPAGKSKYHFWTAKDPHVDVKKLPFDLWKAEAQVTKGSWWGDWLTWVTVQAPEQIPSHGRQKETSGLPSLCPAPGLYVRERS